MISLIDRTRRERDTEGSKTRDRSTGASTSGRISSNGSGTSTRSRSDSSCSHNSADDEVIDHVDDDDVDDFCAKHVYALSQDGHVMAVGINPPQNQLHQHDHKQDQRMAQLLQPHILIMTAVDAASSFDVVNHLSLPSSSSRTYIRIVALKFFVACIPNLQSFLLVGCESGHMFIIDVEVKVNSSIIMKFIDEYLDAPHRAGATSAS
jgi:hypothetical protein